MTSETYAVLCASCGGAPIPRTDDEDGLWGCATCGTADTKETILEEVKEHAVEMVSRHVQDAAKKVASGSSFITFSGPDIPERQYRWVSSFAT
jgi:DNA-directed RNA polymerase subunit M/transcription elongation factor TFIIS